MKLVQGFVLLLWIASIWCKVLVDVDEEIYDCGNSLPNAAVIFSNLEYSLDEDDVLTINGRIDITDDYEAPLGLNFSSQHLERGEWRTGVFSSLIKDFCPDILNRMKPWYFVTKTLNQTYCPYRKGHVEIMDNFKYGTYGVPIPYNMLGEWKLFWEISTKRHGKMVKECNMQRIFLTDG